MKARVTFIRYYTYETEGADIDECIDIAEDELSDNDRCPIAQCGYDDVDYEILEDDEDDEE